MSTKELKEEIKKVVDSSDNEAILEKLLSYANELVKAPKKYELDEFDKRILKEDENLFRRLSK